MEFWCYSCLPQIKLTSEELKVGYDMVSGYRNPIVIRDIQGYNTERNMPSGLMQAIVDNNPECTFLSFGISKQHPSSPHGVSQLRG